MPLPRLADRVDARQARVRAPLRAIVLGVAAYLLAGPLLALGHEVLVVLVAELLGGLGHLARDGAALRALPLDPIYSGAALLTLGGIEVRGLAVAEPIGSGFEALWPSLFEPARLVAPGAWVSAVVAPGAPVVGRWAATLAADAALLGLGVLAVRAGARGRAWLGVAGAIVQAEVILRHLVEAPPPLAEVEAAGIPFAVAMLLSGDVQAGPRLSETLEALPPGARGAVLGAGMVLAAYLPVVIFLRMPWLVRRARAIVRRRTARVCGGTSGWSLARRLSIAGLASAAGLPSRLVPRLAPFGLAMAVALSPVGDLAEAETNFLTVAEVAAPHEITSLAEQTALRDLAVDTRPATARGAATLPESPPPAVRSPVGPSAVAVTGGNYRYTYSVNGASVRIQGMGYNVRYSALPPEERARRLDRDFALLRQAGVNTVFGWEPREFDEILLDAAERHGLGVAPPFELDPDAAYADPEVRRRVEAEVVAWVERYRAHPAVRMWALGNEVLHKLVYPSWMPMRSDPEWEERARAFARFYVTLLDRVHALDPHHPVVYRDAEDAYLTWMRNELTKEARRPWFVYGINAYTPRLEQILAAWPTQGFDVPLLISEFAPGGVSPADRPEGFRAMWAVIRRAEEHALGGSVYAWTTDGPEEVDRVFGLTDGDGRPVDGALGAVAALFRGNAGSGLEAAPGDAEAPAERVRARAGRTTEASKAGEGVDRVHLPRAASR